MYFLRFLFAGLVGVILAGCIDNPRVLMAGAEHVNVITELDSVPDNAVYIGNITEVDGKGCNTEYEKEKVDPFYISNQPAGFYEGTYEKVIIRLRNRAHAMGGNFVQITQQQPPRYLRRCFLNEYKANATVYKVPTLQTNTSNGINQ